MLRRIFGAFLKSEWTTCSDKITLGNFVGTNPMLRRIFGAFLKSEWTTCSDKITLGNFVGSPMLRRMFGAFLNSEWTTCSDKITLNKPDATPHVWGFPEVRMDNVFRQNYPG